MDIGTFCWLSARFSAVTVISSSSPAGAAVVSAANTHTGPISAAAPKQARQPFDIPIVILPAKRKGFKVPSSMLSVGRGRCGN